MPNDKEFELDDLESFSFDDLSLDEAPPGAEPVPGEDPFGVWVKSAPEDLDAPASAPAVPGPEPEDLPEEDFLSSEELANLDDSFEFVTVEEPVADNPNDAEETFDDEVAFLDTPEAVEAERTSTEPSATPSFDEISLDDFVNFDEPEQGNPAPRVPSGPTLEAASTEDDFSEEFLDIDIDIEDDINDEELEVVEGATPRSDEEASALVPGSDDFGTQDVDLTEFGDFEEVTPLASVPVEDELPEVKELPEIAALDDDPFLGDDGFFEEEVFEDPMTILEDEGPVSLDLEPDDQTDLDHIRALEDDLTSGIRENEPVPTSDKAAEILGKIEQELSSIKQEISELKREVTHLRDLPREASPASVPPPAPVEAEPAPEEEGAKSHGFFDEEDDETIALTGDELDNILSTAEISEGEEAGLDLDEDLLGLDTEGNLIEPEVVHVTDEEFLAGTALADDELAAGVPESIELEESFPLELDSGETEDLLAGSDLNDEVAPLPEGLLEGEPAPLELPSDDDLGLELAEAGNLTPDLIDNDVSVSEELSLDDLDLDSSEEADGWSPQPAEELPAPPAVTLAQTPADPTPTPGSGMSSGLKDELRAVLSYMDKLLASLPDDKIQEFAESEHFEVYKRLFEELGLIE